MIFIKQPKFIYRIILIIIVSLFILLYSPTPIFALPPSINFDDSIPLPTPQPTIIPYASNAAALLSPVETPLYASFHSTLLQLEQEFLNHCKLGHFSWIGKASYYTRNGCLGCNVNLQMANGQTLHDRKYTIAFMHAPLNSKVEIKNIDTGSNVIATVTDRGGFESLGRIADVSAAVEKSINLLTDQSNIQITPLYCK